MGRSARAGATLAVFSAQPLRPLHYQLAKSCYFSKVFDPASFLPARSLPAAALLALRRRSAAYGIRHTVAAMPRCLCGENHFGEASS
ncbi:MAG: hypothetical protein ACR2L2_14580 [Acidobacteriota bacterium]